MCTHQKASATACTLAVIIERVRDRRKDKSSLMVSSGLGYTIMNVIHSISVSYVSVGALTEVNGKLSGLPGVKCYVSQAQVKLWSHFII